MACHEKSFSSYQREAINKVSALVGNIPFNYEKSANNHLQIKIDGIDRVFFTASTPSDSRSLDNFIGHIRAEINRLKAQTLEQQTPLEQPKSQEKVDARKSAQLFMEAVADKSLKDLQRKLKQIEQEEYQVFKATDSDNPGNSVREFRKNLISTEVNQAVKAGKGPLFIPPGLNKKCQAKLEDYLSTMLPSIPEYHSRMNLELNQHLADYTDTALHIKPMVSAPIDPSAIKPLESAPLAPQPHIVDNHAPKLKHTSKPEVQAAMEAEPLLNDLINAKPHKRIAMLKALPKQKIAVLIEDCQRALQQKHQDDIDFLAEQMQNRGVTLDELQDALK